MDLRPAATTAAADDVKSFLLGHDVLPTLSEAILEPDVFLVCTSGLHHSNVYCESPHSFLPI